MRFLAFTAFCALLLVGCTVHSSGENVPVKLELEYLKDDAGLFDIHRPELQSMPFEKFQAVPVLTPGSRYWFRARLPEMQRSKNERWFVQLGFPSIDSATGYLRVSGDTVPVGKVGDEVPYTQWPVVARLPTFPATSNGVLAESIYIELQATGQPAIVPLRLVSEPTLVRSEQIDYLWYGFFFGTVVALAVYNLMLYAATRLAGLLPYVIYLSAFALLQASITGIGQQFIWPNLANFTTSFALCLIGFTNGAMAFFVISFLEISRKKPLQYYSLLVMAAFSFVLPLGLLFVEYIYIQNIQHVFALISMAAILAIALHAYRSGNHLAIYVLLSYLVLFFGISMALLLFNGYLGSSFLTRHIMEMSILFEALVLSLGLSHRINRIQERARQLEVKNRESQAQFTRQLIAAHESEKQHFGAILHDDIGHQVLMLQGALKALHPSSANHDPKLDAGLSECVVSTEAILEELRRLSTTSHPHLLTELGLDKALQSLLERALGHAEISFAFHMTPVQFPKSLQQQLYRIVQELVSNTVKHAGATEVLLSIICDTSGTALIYKDDGNGIKTSTRGKGSGFGLYSIQERCRLIGAKVSFSSPSAVGMQCHIKEIQIDDRKNCFIGG